MQILDIKTLNGPNIWSNTRQKLIVLKLVLEKKDKITQKNVMRIAEGLAKLLPGLRADSCTCHESNHFFNELKSSIPLGDLVAHVALSLQQNVGMKCNFARSAATRKEDIDYAIYEYEIENAGILAAESAVEIVQCLLTHKTYTGLPKVLQRLKRIEERDGLGPSTKAIVNEAIKRNIPYRRINDDSLVILGYGRYAKLINSTATSDTSIIGADLVSDKDFTKKILARAYLPVPTGVKVRTLEQLKDAIEEIKFPLVIKPLNGNHGRGVTTNIVTKEKAYIAYKLARKISPTVIVEHFITGFDYRFLVVNYKLVAVARRDPASVTGDGVSTIKELINKINSDPRRGNQHANVLTKIVVDETTQEILQSQALNLESILKSGRKINLKYSANLSTGGTAFDVTDQVHPENFYIAERVAHLLNLNLCGIDVVCKNISMPLNLDNGAIVEVNASPGIRMHLAPSEGKPRDIGKYIMEMLYPIGSYSRIPIVAVTGTNGKTTTVRLIANFAHQMGYRVGYTTTDGIYIRNKLIYKGDCSGPLSAANILREPFIDFAVLECARGGILDYGLGFDSCDISIVTNISADHLGINDVETIEDLAKVKKVVPKSTYSGGYAILNADDDLVYAMKEDLECSIALFSMEHSNPRIEKHCRAGGTAAYVKQDNIIIRQGDVKKVFANVNDIPLTQHGTSSAMIQDILAAILAGAFSNFSVPHMAKLLKNFSPSAENIPGRMNLFDFNKFKVLVDYGHNVGAFVEMKKYLEHVKCKKKIGIIGSPGDRRNEDIMNIGYYSAQIFDEIIIKHDKYGRGRTNQEITSLIKKGIVKYDPSININVISDEQKALEFAIKNVKSGGFIAIFPDDVTGAINYLNKVSESNTKSNMKAHMKKVGSKP